MLIYKVRFSKFFKLLFFQSVSSRPPPLNEFGVAIFFFHSFNNLVRHTFFGDKFPLLSGKFVKKLVSNVLFEKKHKPSFITGQNSYYQMGKITGQNSYYQMGKISTLMRRMYETMYSRIDHVKHCRRQLLKFLKALFHTFYSVYCWIYYPLWYNGNKISTSCL